MRQLENSELDARIHDFLDKKFTKYPELRDSFKLGTRGVTPRRRKTILYSLPLLKP